MEIRRYLLALRQWWWLMVLGILVTAGSGYLFSSQQPATYSSTVRVIVGQTLQNVNPDYGSLAASERLASTYAELAQSRLIAQKTSEALGEIEPTDFIITVKPVIDTEFIDIIVQSSDPEQAANIANEVANQLILQSPTGPQSPDAKILAEVQKQIDTLNQQIQNNEQEIEELRAKLKNLEVTAPTYQETQLQVQQQQQILSEDRRTLSTLYSTVLGNKTNSINIVEPALANPFAISPKPVRTSVLLGILGVLLSIGFILGLEYIDDTIKSPDQAVDIMQAPLLAAIVKQAKAPELPTDRLIVKLDPRSPSSEGFRTLRTNLQFSNIDSKTRTIVITSSQPSEGKSTVSSNLAWTIAEAGQRVILIDADLRKPILHKIFDLSNKSGLTNILSNVDDPTIAEQSIHEIFPGLHVLPSGPQPPNPSELLSSKRMEMLIWLFQQDYDWVIFDTPPLLTVTDALALAPRVDGTMVVVEGNRTQRAVLQKTALALKTVGSNIIGITVNKLDSRTEGYYSYYTYYYDSQYESQSKTSKYWPWSRKKPIQTDPVSTLYSTQSRTIKPHISDKPKDKEEQDA